MRLCRCLQTFPRTLFMRSTVETPAPAVSSEQDLMTAEKPLYGTDDDASAARFTITRIEVGRYRQFEGGDHSADAPQEATAFSALGGRLELENIVLEDVDSVYAVLREHTEGLHPSRPHEDTEIRLYVCTHGERDCRCGDMGRKVVSALKKEVKERGASADRVRIEEVGHVGGHQYAANVLVFPHGEWLGRVTPETVPELLTTVLASPRRPFTPSDPPLLRDHWRGRTGLGKEE
ncbi:uncharacterized protein LACBIDRAFT_318811 [Laccaria bicolor S238N-H82]|uniref:Predicted protein n=1 Tax=Laccaria bicolor (strain S238N-H82 / ATCC MYA-4686) TaxID=486041 RepID=B0D754_LACBS|nr:uncharacterized protein LACBIDRAFT_318811 [Laccaria bicolor S238N-H82]EDR09337.1 predicted protein [Laccaria bicolor S238N-H82]|eukprot:XP_001879686.1 predicted protein [Laccaria bicolor S238N-H82]